MPLLTRAQSPTKCLRRSLKSPMPLLTQTQSSTKCLGRRLMCRRERRRSSPSTKSRS
ncbi:hypothetical protein ANCCAN_24604 [Ancylostoma caninum]|uniref:Uncharacterized protein n=1 Tax=Ancylostoma caninum TaxID=29170 RepID=A0A368FBU0_ANCCA|nr:hypothetical protein ANCCAN_24604 [Ancylostoma caninum]